MKNYYFIFLSFIIIVFSNCTPEPILGCTDSESINYNATATESDGNCLYVSDLYVGNYVLNETSIFKHSFFPIPDTTTQDRTFTIAKLENNKIELQGFLEPACYLEAIVTENVVEMINYPAFCFVFYDDTVRREGEKIIYTYKYRSTSSGEYVVTGVAIKE
ncbi:MAG: hypothetical protein HC803_10615 [Saprospiraceae bacterium]|nr:hypothetical protein [Saprospiraceae bacterium]